MQKIRWFIWIALVATAITLAVQNNNPAPVKILWIERELPLSVLLIATSGLGFLAGAMMTALMLRKSRREPTLKTTATTPEKSSA